MNSLWNPKIKTWNPKIQTLHPLSLKTQSFETFIQELRVSKPTIGTSKQEEQVNPHEEQKEQGNPEREEDVGLNQDVEIVVTLASLRYLSDAFKEGGQLHHSLGQNSLHVSLI